MNVVVSLNYIYFSEGAIQSGKYSTLTIHLSTTTLRKSTNSGIFYPELPFLCALFFSERTRQYLPHTTTQLTEDGRIEVP